MIASIPETKSLLLPVSANDRGQIALRVSLISQEPAEVWWRSDQKQHRNFNQLFVRDTTVLSELLQSLLEYSHAAVSHSIT